MYVHVCVWSTKIFQIITLDKIYKMEMRNGVSLFSLFFLCCSWCRNTTNQFHFGQQQQPLNYYIISSTSNVSIFNVLFCSFSVPIHRFFSFVKQKMVQYHAHSFFFVVVVRTNFLHFTCKWVVLNVLQLTIELRLVSLRYRLYTCIEKHTNGIERKNPKYRK